ncbi:MAG: hypothetical protein R3Y07_04585 [Eubacteriales bacterium]
MANPPILSKNLIFALIGVMLGTLIALFAVGYTYYARIPTPQVITTTIELTTDPSFQFTLDQYGELMDLTPLSDHATPVLEELTISTLAPTTLALLQGLEDSGYLDPPTLTLTVTDEDQNRASQIQEIMVSHISEHFAEGFDLDQSEEDGTLTLTFTEQEVPTEPVPEPEAEEEEEEEAEPVEITIQMAIDVALARAGVTATQVTNLAQKRTEGVFHVSFTVNNFHYEVTLSDSTLEILTYDLQMGGFNPNIPEIDNTLTQPDQPDFGFGDNFGSDFGADFGADFPGGTTPNPW